MGALSRVAGLLGLAQSLPQPVAVEGPKRGRKVRYSSGIAAWSSGSRQNERRLNVAFAFRTVTQEYPGEPRSVRRRMARELGKRTWRKEHGLPELAHA